MAYQPMAGSAGAQPWKNAICKVGLCCIPMCPSVSCCKAVCCPCVLYGQMAEQLDGSSCAQSCCMFWLCMPICNGCILGSRLRKKIRDRYHLEESCISDAFATCCCACCAMLQAKAEIEERGALTLPPQQQHM